MNEKIGILLVNLGTPDSPKPRDVFRYLNEFLTDGRVIDIPWLWRQLLVRGVIVPRRYRQSAKNYQSIWTPEGSPLKVYGYRVRDLLQNSLGPDFRVELAMRYQNPSISTVLESMQGLSDIIVIPLFPQYSSATTGSVHQKIMEKISKWQRIPRITFVNHYYRHPSLINAFIAAANSYKLENYDHILFSFHGLPERHVIKADCRNHCLKSKDCCKAISGANRECYSAQCYATAEAIAKKMKIPSERFSVAFQSRLGREPWLQPYTGETVTNLARNNAKKILVFCPSFVCDCLETIEEIGVEYAKEFTQAGGVQLDLVPGLNDHPAWIETLAEIVRENRVK